MPDALSPAGELREAARLMRERAEGASILADPPWKVSVEGEPAVPWVTSGRGLVIAPGYLPHCDHIASWHPGVALAVADWLEREAASIAGLRSAAAYTVTADWAAMKVARAYLGSKENDRG